MNTATHEIVFLEHELPIPDGGGKHVRMFKAWATPHQQA